MSTEWRSRLLQTVEREIVPRLLMTSVTTPGASNAQRPPDAADVASFAWTLRGRDPDTSLGLVEARLAAGDTHAQLYTGLFAPAARHLGALWEDDRCTFADVTVGLCRLHGLLREVGDRVPGVTQARPSAPRALVVAAPGEQHVFGAAMVGAFFRAEGWHVHDAQSLDRGALVATARDYWFDVIGLSVAGDVQFAHLGSDIRSVRRVSRNPGVGIVVGGAAFDGHPERVRLVGADASAADAPGAVRTADRLVAMVGEQRAS